LCNVAELVIHYEYNENTSNYYYEIVDLLAST
jgi:hypothetical protein